LKKTYALTSLQKTKNILLNTLHMYRKAPFGNKYDLQTSIPMTQISI